MKRMTAILLCLVVAFAHFPVYAAGTKTYTSGDFTYFLADDGTAVINMYTGESDIPYLSPYMLDIPAVLDGHTVTGIDAFTFHSSIAPTSIKPTSITIPDSVTSIDERAFYDCHKLTNIDVAEKNPMYLHIDGVLFDKPKMLLYTYPAGKGDTAYAIPEGTLAIGTYAFAWSRHLISVTIPDSVTSIGKWAFFGCISLTSATIPDSVTSIGEEAFSSCDSLTSLSIPGSVTSIGEGAFSKWQFDEKADNFMLTVERGSYGEQYAIENKIPYQYPID